MTKKIQLSTVRQEADVEVVFVNANLICKVINACNAAQAIIDNAEQHYCIKAQREPALNENGEPIVDENGCGVEKPVLDKKGNQVYNYGNYRMAEDELRDLHIRVLPFLTELRNALEGE